MSEQDLFVQSLRSFINEPSRFLRAEKQVRSARFGVTSLEEMDRLIAEGAEEEEEIPDDFQNVDYLTARIEHIEHLLRPFNDRPVPSGPDGENRIFGTKKVE